MGVAAYLHGEPAPCRRFSLGAHDFVYPTDISFSDRVQFGTAVRNRAWDWLLALRRRLSVDLQIVDDAHTPLLTGQVAAPLTTNIETLLAAGVPGLRTALSTAMRTKTPQAASVERAQLLCLPLSTGRTAGGALVLARRGAEDAVRPERTRGELELIGFWLCTAIEAHLQSHLAAEGDLDRWASLCRVLRDAAARGSDREIVATFAETLALWHDSEAYGYVQTGRGEFVREVSLPGADLSLSPAQIPRGLLPESVQLTQLSKSDGERLGFRTPHDLAVTRSTDDIGSWLLVVAGPISHEMPRLGLYLALLEQALSHAIDASTAHVVTAMARHLLDPEHPADEQARQAIAEIQRTLRVSSAALTVTTASGAPLVRVGSPLVIGEGAKPDRGQLVVVRRAPPQHSTMALAVEWPAGRQVTRQEHCVVHASADLLESWVRRLVRESKGAGERRATARRFDEALERFARQALEGGVPVTAVVLSFGDVVFRPGVTQTRIGRIREQVRATDLVGRLGEGEIGMLLHDAAGDQAKTVADRLLRILETAGEGPSVLPAVGFASRLPSDPKPDALLEEAQQDALRHAGET